MEKTLVVLAAGMGSRFGGLKQIEPVGPNGEFIIDYSVYDAIKAGFSKVVFVIKEENFEIFKNTIGSRLEGKIKVEYAFQKLSDIPKDITLEREKPLGTGHALYAARDLIQGPFAIINADDFYGRDAYFVLSEFLNREKGIGIVGYHIGETLSENGSVKRGVIFNEGNFMTKIVESKVSLEDNMALCEPLNGNASFKKSLDSYAGMSIYGFNLDFLELLVKDIDKFLENADLTEDEYLIPDVIDDYLKLDKVEILSTTAKWMGMTYKEDLDFVKNHINNLINDGTYPSNLWGNNERKN